MYVPAVRVYAIPHTMVLCLAAAPTITPSRRAMPYAGGDMDKFQERDPSPVAVIVSVGFGDLLTHHHSPAPSVATVLCPSRQAIETEAGVSGCCRVSGSTVEVAAVSAFIEVLRVHSVLVKY
jgi:hypothetical protein